MTERNFREMLERRWDLGTFVCVGLDPDLTKIPNGYTQPSRHRTIQRFLCEIVDATAEFAAAFKPNFAFFEAYGGDGIDALQDTIAHIRIAAHDVPVILDGKRADIDSTNEGTLKMLELLDVDAVTVNPYLGGETLAPFLRERNKGIFVLCRTSNKGSGEFQDLSLSLPEGEWKGRIPLRLYQYVALRFAKNWNGNGNVGFVAGATYPDELATIRDLVDDAPLLIPGIGKQGGDLEVTVRNGRDLRKKGIIVNSSRAILYASSGPDFAEAARRETVKLRDAINSVPK